MEETEILIKKAKLNKIIIIILTLSLFLSLVYITYDKLKPKAKEDKVVKEHLVNNEKEQDEEKPDIFEDPNAPTSSDAVNFWKQERKLTITDRGRVFGHFRLTKNELTIIFDESDVKELDMIFYNFYGKKSNIAPGAYKVPGSYVDFSEYAVGVDVAGIKGVLAVKDDGTVSFINYHDFLENGKVKVTDNFKDFKEIVSIKWGDYTAGGPFGGVSTILTDINGQQIELTVEK